MCYLLLGSLLWIRNLLLNFPKQNKLLHSILQQNSFHVFSHLFLTVVRSVVAVTRTSAAGHPLHQAASFHSFVISFHFFQGFLLFDFFMIMCFSLFLFGVFLYSFFSFVFTFFCHFFVFPTVLSSLFLNKKSLLVLSLLFRSALVVTLFLWALLFFNFSFFTHFLNLFFTPKNLSLLLCTWFSLFFSFVFFDIFLCFSFCSPVCSLFFVVYNVFCTFFFLYVSFFLKKKIPVLISFHF